VETSVNGEHPAETSDNDHIFLTDIDNPLIRLSPAELVTAVQEFAGVYDLEHIRDLLVSGAKVARDPEAYQSVPGLTLDERAALRKEKEAGFWRQTKQLRASIIMCAVAAILHGWDQSAINGE
jgi:hypothetical protein